MAPSPDATAGDTQYLTLLPSLTLAAWHHKKLAPDMSSMGAEQSAGRPAQFASREYLHALYKGDRMIAGERARVMADLARLTGLPTAFLVNNDLRVTLDRFNTELMREEHRGLSLSDARVDRLRCPRRTRQERGGGGSGGGGAAVEFNTEAILAGGFQRPTRPTCSSELGFTGPWTACSTFERRRRTFTSTGNDEARPRRAPSRAIRACACSSGVNYFDLTAPFYAVEFTVAHLNVSPRSAPATSPSSHYEAGHMAYVDNEALVKLHGDLAAS